MVIPRQSVLDGQAKLPQWIAKETDVTATRALDTNYQNTTGRPTLQIITIRSNRANVVGAAAVGTGAWGPTTPPSNVGCIGGFKSQDNNPDYGDWTLVLFVPAHFYFAVNTTVAGAGSTCTLIYWMEIVL